MVEMVEVFNKIQQRLGRRVTLCHIDDEVVWFKTHLPTIYEVRADGSVFEIGDHGEPVTTDASKWMHALVNGYVRNSRGENFPRDVAEKMKLEGTWN